MIDHPIPGLSRRDRAACVLALEWLRCGATGCGNMDDIATEQRWAVESVLARGDGASLSVFYAIRGAAYRVPPRLLRARLALYLRALLRASAGDYGPQTRGGTHRGEVYREWPAPEEPGDRWAHGQWTNPYPGPGHCGWCGEPRITCRHFPSRIARPLWNLPVDEGEG